MSGDVHKYLDPSYALLLRIVAVDDVRSSADMLRCSCTRPCTSSVRRRLKTRVHAANLRHGGQATAADAAALASARAAVPRRDALALAAGLILLQQQCWWVHDGLLCQWRAACAALPAAAPSLYWCSAHGWLHLVHGPLLYSYASLKELKLQPSCALGLLQGCTSAGPGSRRSSSGGGV